MSFLRFLESIRNPFFDWVFSLVTHIGEETVFLAIAILFLWCINKRKGYYILTVGLVGTVINQILKLSFAVPRPWVKDPDFTIVESARAEATGYSFPSGHTQNIAGTFGAIARGHRSVPVRILSIVIIVLVAFSRMYLGVHTPLDVGVSLAIAALLVFAVYPLFSTEERFERFMPYVLIGCLVLMIVFLLCLPAFAQMEHESENLVSGFENAATLTGCVAGLGVAFLADRLFIKFDTGAAWYVQVIKLAVGFAVVLVIKSALKEPLISLIGDAYLARAARYFIIVIFAGVLWPLTFRPLAKVRIPPLDSFGEKVCSIVKKRDTCKD